MTRQSGFYWVKLIDDIGTQWEKLTVGKFDPDEYYYGCTIVNSDEGIKEADIIVLSDRLEEPSE